MAGSMFDLDKTVRDINKSYDTVERSAQIGAGQSATAEAKNLEKNLARYGGEAFDTGASKQGIGDIFTKMNENIANINNQYAIQRNSQIMSANQYFTDLASRGIIDPTSGSFLKSTFNMQMELNDKAFQNQLALMDKQASAQENAGLFQGLGTLAGMWLNPFKVPAL